MATKAGTGLGDRCYIITWEKIKRSNNRGSLIYLALKKIIKTDKSIPAQKW